MKKRLIKLLQKENILQYGDFVLRSKVHSSYYCDIKQALGNAVTLSQIISLLVPLVPKNATCIVGSGYGGITLASLIAYKKKLPLTLVRDTIKNHGTKKSIDGYLPTKKDCVCIIDDVFTTGSSISDTKEKLKMTKCKFVKPVVVLNRSKKPLVTSVLSDNDLLKQ